MPNYYYLPCGILVWQNLLPDWLNENTGRLIQYNADSIVAVFKITLKPINN